MIWVPRPDVGPGGPNRKVPDGASPSCRRAVPGRIVVDINFDLANDDPDDFSVVWSANVVQGANVAAQIPGLHDFWTSSTRCRA